MTRPLLILGLLLAALVNGRAAEAAPALAPTPRHLLKANVLPLALDDTFQFRKEQLFLNDPKVIKPTRDQTLTFERQRLNFKAITGEELKARYGQYFAFWWRATRPASRLAVRLEYRQENLGAYVQAQEVELSDVRKGTHETKFQVTGDNYNHDGRVTAWRAVLVENGKIVALTQSFLWH